MRNSLLLLKNSFNKITIFNYIQNLYSNNMKNLDAYIKNLYVSLEGIDEELKSKLTNIDGYRITECCGCDCDCSSEPNQCDPTAIDAPTPIITNQFGRFNSEQEIIHELNSQPKVTTLYDIHSQFGRFNFQPDKNERHIEPLYFGRKDYGTIGEIVNRENGDMPTREADPKSIEQLYDVTTSTNKKIYKVVTDVVSTFELECPVVQTKVNGEVQIYAIKMTGTNGEENSIKSSLEEVAKILGKLESKSEIQWAQVLDVAIDNIDDLYTFVLTFVLDSEKVREKLKPEI